MRRLRWVAGAALLLLLGAALFLAFGMQPAPFPPGSESAARLETGELSVARVAIDLVDKSRPTPRNRDYPGAPGRRLQGSVWYPQAGGGYPLLLFSHGFTSTHRNGAYLAKYLASHGYVVAAVNHPLTHLAAPGDPNARDVVNQPGDLGFLIDTLTLTPWDVDPGLVGRIDGERIGAMGISLGGLTVTLAGYHPRLREARLDAVLSMAGPTIFLTQDFFAGRSLPFLMLAGDADALVPWAANAAPVPKKVPGGQLVTLEDGSHTGFSGGAALIRWLRNTDAVGCWSVKRNLDLEDEADWSSLLGGRDAGIDDSVELDVCSGESLPSTLNVLRQHMIARVVVRAFFDSVLGSDPQTRREAARYLRKTLSRELPEVTYGAG